MSFPTAYRDSSTALSPFYVPDVPPTVAFVKRKREHVVFLSTLQVIHLNFTNERKHEAETGDEELMSKKRPRYENRPVVEDIEMPLREREEGVVPVPPAWPVLAIAQDQAQAEFTKVPYAAKNDWPAEAPAEVATQLTEEENKEEEENEEEDEDKFFYANELGRGSVPTKGTRGRGVCRRLLASGMDCSGHARRNVRTFEVTIAADNVAANHFRRE
ncbi:uncharacterized protein BYT42DRAFT_613262 [Radiomyces spectabilis]|uniref:uncharacterized protein n=1 Tax=Radiomyces spectabilis TaxID=64574 RepID=UPI00221ED6F0|nr:uncharacterized protein BYT42DRAFT_613262 [Radiomyces spectabilis]KAI8381486.1 hypothetical protein BYT42DRAFT_613262 [Radiomyces spectabilis]